MANLKASKKDILRIQRNRKRNLFYQSTVKTLSKQVKEAILNNDESAINLLKKTTRFLDKCVSKGIFHKRTVARKKSSLVKLYNAKLSKASA